MKRLRPNDARAEIRISFRSRRELLAVADALKPEILRPAGQKATVRVSVRGRSLIMHLRARDSSTLRAILSSYLRMCRASLSVFERLSQLERSTNFTLMDKR